MTDQSITASPAISDSATDGATAGDFFALLKPRVMSLAIFTAWTGLAIAPQPPHPVMMLTSLIFIAMGAGAAGALNMWYDADIDGLMQRTAMRPVPRGRVRAGDALAFGLMLAAGSTVSLGLLVDWVAASLLAASIAFYIIVYTMVLKRRTSQNIVIGGAAGALPPVIGWAAATGSVSVEPLILFAIIFLWTPPHFWALALYRSRDYSRAGVPMLPVVKGEDETRRQILLYSIALAPFSMLPYFMDFAGVAYLAVAAALGAGLLLLAWRVYVRREAFEADRAARNLFTFSILYLFALFAVLLVEHRFGFAG